MTRQILRLYLAFLLLPTFAAAQTTLPAADWSTPAELSGYRTTPRYDETMAYLRRVAQAAPRKVKLEVFGRSDEGRDLLAVIVSRDGIFNPEVLHRAGRPIVLLQNAIHAGEMDGKDACLALLRDMVITGEKAALLERAVVILLPIYNVDGHERFGAFHRINQNGPEEMGWRTTARNLNLNRDYMKADAPETRAFLRLWNRWLPDFFVDNHVTDGVDYQPDTTYVMETGPNAFPALADWQRGVLAPYLEESVTRAGHVISPYLSLTDPTDPARGLYQEEAQPRYSTGYMVLQNRPGMLVEMHMLKDYRTRVTGNYEILRALLEVVNRDADMLVQMNREADSATIAAGRRSDPEMRYPLRLALTEQTEPMLFRGFRFERSLSEISGAMRVTYTREPVEFSVPARRTFQVARSVAPPFAYIIPPQWKDVTEVLAAHGLRIQRTTRNWTSEVETYRCETPQWLPGPYEGRQVLFTPGSGESNRLPVPPLECSPVRKTLFFPAGSAIIPLDQRAAQVAIHFLEPEAPDSAVAWGFFNAIFERKEYAEGYILENLAREMLARDPRLKQEFETRVTTDPEFARSPRARLNFFYQRSPWWDSRLGLYPVGRLSSLDGVPIGR